MALKKKPVTGMKDMMPAEMEIRDYVIGQIKETYRAFGFSSIETPCVEHIENLCSKQGGDNEKLIFKILKRGEKLKIEEAKEEKVILEFEGVYRKATVYINGEKVAYHSYGYLGFYVDATKHVKFGEENVIRVEVINHDQPNSRWYSGTGIYRPVWLYTVPKNHLRFDSVKITTLDYKEPKIRVEAWPNAAGEVKVEILEKQIVTRKAVAGESAGQTDETIEPCIDENAVQPTVQNSDKASDKIIALEILQADGKFSREIALPGANLWSPDAPNLYTCRVTFGEDIQEETLESV